MLLLRHFVNWKLSDKALCVLCAKLLQSRLTHCDPMGSIAHQVPLSMSQLYLEAIICAYKCDWRQRVVFSQDVFIDIVIHSKWLLYMKNKCSS